MANVQSMLTTTDNPYDPFTQFEMWNRWDEEMGYYTTNYLARVSTASGEMSEEEQREAHEDALQEVVDYNVLGIYKIVCKKVEE